MSNKYQCLKTYALNGKSSIESYGLPIRLSHYSPFPVSVTVSFESQFTLEILDVVACTLKLMTVSLAETVVATPKPMGRCLPMGCDWKFYHKSPSTTPRCLLKSGSQLQMAAAQTVASHVSTRPYRAEYQGDKAFDWVSVDCDNTVTALCLRGCPAYDQSHALTQPHCAATANTATVTLSVELLVGKDCISASRLLPSRLQCLQPSRTSVAYFTE